MTDDPKNDAPLPPEINKYLSILSKDPNSIVFAPLAEAYRKAGMLDEAIATAKDGLQLHPNYLSGLVALGRAYYDKGMLREAEAELEQVVKIAPDNIIAANILAEIRQSSGEGKPQAVPIQESTAPNTPVVSQPVGGNDEDVEEIEPLELEEVTEDQDDLGAVFAPDFFQSEAIPSESETPVLENPSADEESEIIQEEEVAPKKEITTETIAELYIKQGYIDRAIDIYQTLCDAQPENEEIKKKLANLKKQVEVKVEKVGWAEPTSQELGIVASKDLELETRNLESDKPETVEVDNVKRLESWLKTIQNERHRV